MEITATGCWSLFLPKKRIFFLFFIKICFLKVFHTNAASHLFHIDSCFSAWNPPGKHRSKRGHMQKNNKNNNDKQQKKKKTVIKNPKKVKRSVGGRTRLWSGELGKDFRKNNDGEDNDTFVCFCFLKFVCCFCVCGGGGATPRRHARLTMS